MNTYYQQGYDDGFRYKAIAFKHDNMPAYTAYYEGWLKGKSDKDFCETYSDEALGVTNAF